MPTATLTSKGQTVIPKAIREQLGLKPGDTIDFIIAVFEQVMRTAQFEIAEKDEIWRAFEDFSEGSADFSDYLIGRANERAGAQTTLTFDKSLKNCHRFTVL